MAHVLPPRIDLISDTVTLPTLEMREAMLRAPLGDEQRGEDPSTNALCARVADLLGKKAALFLPSGTMCNQIAILVHCRPGDVLFADESAHIVNSEAGAPAALAGAMVRTVHSEHGIFDAAVVEALFKPTKRNTPKSRLIAVEQTANRGGGAIWPLAKIESLAEFAHANGMALHMDGARLMNAVVASGVAADCYTTPCDSAWIDFSKGLGCPMGAVLAGSAEFIEQAWIWKHRLGGAMRQSGILAAAALYALDHHVDRLADDHANATLLANLVNAIPGIRIDPKTVETNLVFIDVRATGCTAQELCTRLLARGVRVGPDGRYRVRAVTHLGVQREDIAAAAAALADAVQRSVSRAAALHR